MKKFIVTLSALVMVLTLSVSAFADSVANLNVGMVGLDGSDGHVFVAVTGGTTCSNYRFYPSNTDVKAALTVLTAAKMSGKKVRIDTLSSDCNSGYRVYVQ